MTQKQMIGIVLGVVVVGLLAIMVARQFSSDDAIRQSASTPAMQQKSTTEPAPVPETVDSITESIVSESRGEATALDDEEAGTLEEVDADSDSVNNLGTSYDENSF
jgi:hypothetical protein